jgi:hypothetical protein
MPRGGSFSASPFSTTAAMLRHGVPTVAALDGRDGRAERARADAAMRRDAVRLYRRLLVASRALRAADDQCGAVMAWFVRTRFAKYRFEMSSRLRLQYLRQGRKHLRLLQRAQCIGVGDGSGGGGGGKEKGKGGRAMEKVIAYSYGTRGKLRHILRHRIHEVKSRRNVDPPKGMSAQVASLPREVLPLLRYCEAEAMRLVARELFSREVEEEMEGDDGNGHDSSFDDEGDPVLHGVQLNDYVRGKFKWWSEFGGNGVPIAQTAAGARSSESTARKKRLYERALGMSPESLEQGTTIELVTLQLEHVPVTVDDFFSSPLSVARNVSDLTSSKYETKTG